MTLHGGRPFRGGRTRVGVAALGAERAKLKPIGDGDVQERPVIHAPTAFVVVQHEQLRDLSPP